MDRNLTARSKWSKSQTKEMGVEDKQPDTHLSSRAENKKQNKSKQKNHIVLCPLLPLNTDKVSLVLVVWNSAFIAAFVVKENIFINGLAIWILSSYLSYTTASFLTMPLPRIKPHTIWKTAMNTV